MSKRLKRLFIICLIIVIWLGSHIAYLYINDISPKISVKWGTVVEWIIDPLNYLPYTSNTKTDKFYQSLLFGWCKQYQFSWWKVSLENNLCDVYTNNNKTYYITIVKDLKWIDDVQFTIEDVLFTYQDILKNNILNFPNIENYAKIDIAKIDDNKIKVEFPNASVDNQWFFANPILPKHILKDKDLDYYIDQFATQPIYISCAVLDLVRSQNNNIIFDLTQCEQLLPKLLQVKKFENKEVMDIYTRSPESIMDYTTDWENLVWYKNYQLSTSTVYTLFFNTASIPESYRTLLGTYFSSLPYTDIKLSDPYKIFSMPWWYDQDKLSTFFKNKSTIVASSNANQTPFLPSNIRLAWKNKFREYYVDFIPDVYSIRFNFDYPYDKIGISSNSGGQYFPDTYNITTRSTDFNLSPKYNNIVTWKNIYTIYWYEKWEMSKVATITIYHGVKPINAQQNIAPTYQKYNFVYLTTTWSDENKVINDIRIHLTNLWSADHINFIPIYNTKDLEKRIQSKDYDFVLLPIDLGNKSDLSALFSDNVIVNPSLYINKTLGTKVQQYFWWNTNNKSDIISVYSKLTPFVMLGSPYSFISVKDKYDVAFDGLDLSNFRYYLINNLGKYEKIELEKDVIINWNNFRHFINKKTGLFDTLDKINIWVDNDVWWSDSLWSWDVDLSNWSGTKRILELPSTTWSSVTNWDNTWTIINR